MAPRSKWKVPVLSQHVLKRIQQNPTPQLERERKKPKQKLKKGFHAKRIEGHKIYARNATITSICLGHSFAVHNGKDFITVTITEDMIGKKFGQFSITKKPCIFLDPAAKRKRRN